LDLLFAAIESGLINFTNLFQNEKLLLQILSIYFLGYGTVWIIGIGISKKNPEN